MANHLTPDELSKELGIDRQEVIRVCVEEGVPIYQGKIDKTLFQAQLAALGSLRLVRHGAQRLELRREERLVDLALVDRHALLDADADDLLAVDAELLGQLFRRQMVRHAYLLGTKTPVGALARTGEVGRSFS